MTGVRTQLRFLPWWIRVLAALLLGVLILGAALSVRRNPDEPRPSDEPNGQATPTESPLPQTPTTPSRETTIARGAEGELVHVIRVIDGDTIEVRLGDSARPVRYIGIDTPERVDCYYRESTAKNAELVAGRQLLLQKDVSETDRYKRLLRYVYVGDLFVNAELVHLGYAAAATVPPDVRHAELFVRLAREARETERGLWSPSVCPDG